MEALAVCGLDRHGNVHADDRRHHDRGDYVFRDDQQRLYGNINTALNAAFGTSAIVASGASLAALILTFSGTGYAGRPINNSSNGTVSGVKVIATLLTGATGFTVGNSTASSGRGCGRWPVARPPRPASPPFPQTRANSSRFAGPAGRRQPDDQDLRGRRGRHPRHRHERQRTEHPVSARADRRRRGQCPEHRQLPVRPGLAGLGQGGTEGESGRSFSTTTCKPRTDNQITRQFEPGAKRIARLAPGWPKPE